MPKLTVDFTDEEFTKLSALAEYRRMSPENCIRSFIRNCQPGGSGWKHPSSTVHEEKPAEEPEAVVASEGGEER